MRRVLAALGAACALLASAAVPANAQDSTGPSDPGVDITELPRLGYEIEPSQGFVGDELTSRVDVADLRDQCWDVVGMDFEDSPSDIFGWLADAFASGDITAHQAVTSFVMNVISYVAPGFAHAALALFEPDDVQEIQAAWEDVYGPPPTDPLDPGPVSNFVGERPQEPVPEGIPDDADGQDFIEQLSAAFNIAFIFGITQVTPSLYPQMHVTTFVDPASQEMIGEMGNFDPFTGEGTMAVPELAPALYAVASACVFFPPVEQFMATWDDGLVNAWNYSVECAEAGGEACFPHGPDDDWEEWAEEGGFGALLEPILAPRALGLDFFCILDDDGYCAVPPEPVGLIDDDAINGMGDPAGEPPGDGDAPSLDLVDASPAFTG